MGVDSKGAALTSMAVWLCSGFKPRCSTVSHSANLGMSLSRKSGQGHILLMGSWIVFRI